MVVRMLIMGLRRRIIVGEQSQDKQQPQMATNERVPLQTKLALPITVGALFVAVIHVAWPDLKIDTITLGLLVVAMVPWLGYFVTNLSTLG